MSALFFIRFFPNFNPSFRHFIKALFSCSDKVDQNKHFLKTFILIIINRTSQIAPYKSLIIHHKSLIVPR